MAISLPIRKPASERIPGPACFQLIKAFEGWRPRAYRDEGGILTIGWGFTANVKEGDTIDISTAESRLVDEVSIAAQRVRDKVDVPLTQTEFDALVSYEYNVRGGLKPSLLACLNGGTTDTGDLMSPGSYEAAVYQVIRAHWGDRTWPGKSFPDGMARKLKTPIRGLYRRRLAEACVFKGLTEWQGPCSENLIKMPVEVYQTAAGVWKARAREVDTTDPESVFERATEEMRYKPPVMDVTKAWPSTTTVIIEKPQAAAPEASTEAKEGGAASPQPTPSPSSPTEQVQQRSVESPVAAGPAPQDPPILPLPGEGKPVAPATIPAPQSSGGAEKAAEAKPVAPRPSPLPLPPPVIAGQDGTKPKSPYTVPITEVPYRIDPHAGLKPMEESDRWKASMVQNVGMTIMRLSRYGAFGSGLKATADVVEKDGVLMQTYQMFFLVIAMGVIGYTVRVYGDWRRRRAEDCASQALY